MSQFQRLASSHDRLVAAQARLQQRGEQPGQETGSESKATHLDVADMDVAVGMQAQVMVIAPLQAIGAAEAQAQVTVSPEGTLQAIEGDPRDTQASPFSPLCRWT